MFLTSSNLDFCSYYFYTFFFFLRFSISIFYIPDPTTKDFLIEFPIEAILYINTYIYIKKEQFNSDKLKPAECCIPRRRKCRKCRIPPWKADIIFILRSRNLFLVIFFQAVAAAAHSPLSLPSRPVSTCSREYTGNQM